MTGAENERGEQIFVFLVCVLTGVASGVVYEVFYILRKLFPSAFSIAFDVAFFLVFAGMSIFASVLFAFPNFRVYMYLGNALGLILYLKSIHLIVAFLWKLCYNKARKVLKRRKSTKNSKKKEVHSI